MAKTVLITGASTGIGSATAQLFSQQGWNVVATMRTPSQATHLQDLPNTRCLRLDVTDAESIQQAIATTVVEWGAIDVVVNNAGYALMGAFEACTPEQIERQFATNVFGLMAVTRAVLPHLRERRTGVIVNIASIGGHIALPFYSLYHATKWAVEGFSDALQYELEPFNIRVKLVEPGPIKTDFYDRSPDIASQPGLTAYDALVTNVLPKLNRFGTTGASPEAVAQVIYRAATDRSSRLRYPAGGNAGLVIALRKLLPDSWLGAMIRRFILH
jgi:NAD(P)-dependent dehydrogenase (short-subunit alcohol dehydrogenase family)